MVEGNWFYQKEIRKEKKLTPLLWFVTRSCRGHYFWAHILFSYILIFLLTISTTSMPTNLEFG